jgi:hypothetical protein
MKSNLKLALLSLLAVMIGADSFAQSKPVTQKTT